MDKIEKEVKVIKIKEETKDTKTFTLSLKSSELNFLPGQFIMVWSEIEGKEVKRPFSISSSPEDEYVEITIKEEANGYFSKHSCQDVKEGHNFKVKGPYGSFIYNGEDKPLLIIAAGSGIAPMRSIIKHALEKGNENKISLLDSNKTEEDIIFKEELEELEKKHENFKIYNHITRQEAWEGRQHRINEEDCKECLTEETICYVCGHPDMVKGIVEILKNIGVDEERIKIEQW